MLALPDPLRHTHMTLMPQVLNLRHLPGFRERQPVIPSGAVYIGRRNGRDGLIATILVGPLDWTLRDGGRRATRHLERGPTDRPCAGERP